MKRLLFPLLLGVVSPVWGAQDLPYLLTPSSGEPSQLSWATEPGRRYDLWESTDLDAWKRVEGFPKAAAGLSLAHAFTSAVEGRRFFRFTEIDEQPPVIMAQYPAVDGFAVGRFADLAIELEDATGIDPTSLR